MATKIINILTKREVDFSPIKGTSLLCFVAVRAVDVTHGENAELLVRIHERTMTGDSLIGVQLVPVSLTPEEPSVDFLVDSGSTTAVITPSSPVSVPALVIAQVQKPYGSHIQVQVKGMLNTAGPETIRASISADLILKD